MRWNAHRNTNTKSCPVQGDAFVADNLWRSKAAVWKQ